MCKRPQDRHRPSFKPGNVWRFTGSELEAWIEDRKQATSRKQG